VWDWSVLSQADNLSMNTIDPRLLNNPLQSKTNPLEHPNEGSVWDNNDSPEPLMAVPMSEIAAFLPNNREQEERKRKEGEEENRARKEAEKKNEQMRLEAEKKKNEENIKLKEMEDKKLKDKLEQEKKLDAQKRKQEEEKKKKLEEEKKKKTEEIERKKEKTDREIGEERQRLLDEGMLMGSGDSEVDNLLNSADLDGLANLLLEGNGNRLIGRTSENQSVQSFLDNVGLYMVRK